MYYYCSVGQELIAAISDGRKEAALQLIAQGAPAAYTDKVLLYM